VPIAGGLDIHRKQITFDYLDTATGEVKRGQLAPADRKHVRVWLARVRRPGGDRPPRERAIPRANASQLQATPSDARRLSSLVKCPLSDTEPRPATSGR